MNSRTGESLDPGEAWSREASRAGSSISTAKGSRLTESRSARRRVFQGSRQPGTPRLTRSEATRSQRPTRVFEVASSDEPANGRESQSRCLVRRGPPRRFVDTARGHEPAPSRWRPPMNSRTAAPVPRSRRRREAGSQNRAQRAAASFEGDDNRERHDSRGAKPHTHTGPPASSRWRPPMNPRTGESLNPGAWSGEARHAGSSIPPADTNPRLRGGVLR
jgi:hypothetical protein